jgi:hypothetical protein
MNFTLYPAIISATVAIFIFAFNHIFTFYSNKRSKRKTNLENRLKVLYTPLYLQIRVQSQIDSRYQMDLLPLDKRLPGYEFEDIDKLIKEQPQYASNELFEKWTECVIYRGDSKLMQVFAKEVVKEYNELKKELKLEFDEIELSTGFPKGSYMYIFSKSDNEEVESVS